MGSAFDFLSSGSGRYRVDGLHNSGNIRIKTDVFAVALCWAGVFKEEKFNVYIYEEGRRTPILNWEIEEKKFRDSYSYLDCSAKGKQPKAKRT